MNDFYSQNQLTYEISGDRSHLVIDSSDFTMGCMEARYYLEDTVNLCTGIIDKKSSREGLDAYGRTPLMQFGRKILFDSIARR